MQIPRSYRKNSKEKMHLENPFWKEMQYLQAKDLYLMDKGLQEEFQECKEDLQERRTQDCYHQERNRQSILQD